MQFIATHDVTAEDIARAIGLTARPTDAVLSLGVVVVLAAILSQVLYAFSVYVKAAAGSPGKLVEFLLFHDGPGNAAMGWLSIVVTLCLPIFLFYALRSLAETLRPAWRVRRLAKISDVCGLTTYTVDDAGVRAARAGGTETFMPWTNFDGLRCDSEIASLTHRGRLRFFVPLQPFGAQRDQVRAYIQSRVAETTAVQPNAG